MDETTSTRRTFLKAASTVVLGSAFFSRAPETANANNVARYNPPIPDHLPKKLALCSWQFAWVTAARPEEPYGNLEKVMGDLKARGFNAIRIDAGLSFCFQEDGSPRGDVAFGQMITGYSDRFRVAKCRGGARHDVLQQVIRLMELAREYDVYVILTSWEYMHTHWFIADPQLRAEIEGVPLDRRLARLVRHEDRLLNILKEKDLQGHIAYVEPHNEVNESALPKKQAGKKVHEEAIAFLRDRHPDILIAGDLSWHNLEELPENTQVYDHHMYVGSDIYSKELYPRTVCHPDFDPENPRNIALLDYLLEENIMPWDEFMAHTKNLGSFWSPVLWLYHNLDIPRFDRWMLEKYAELEPKLKQRARDAFAEIAQGAIQRNLPLAMEEGSFFCAPMNSRWEESEQGLGYLEFITELAIQHNYWCFLPTTYNGPENPIWWACPEWLKKNNTRFLKG